MTLSFVFEIVKTGNASTANHPYEVALNSYLARKADGASAQERLKLLEGLYSQFGSQNIDLVWLAQEFETLGQP